MDAAVQDGVPGVAGQAKDKYGTWKGTSGVGNLRTNKPRSAHDRYRVGSITKTFVSTVLLQLEAEGRLSLDDKVEKWLPGVVRGNGHDGSRITLRQLLNHTSGIFNYTDDEDFGRTYFLKDGFFEHRFDRLSPAQLVKVATAHKPDFEPGTSWNYSNTNYVLAGMVIEKATGHTYGDEVGQRIIEPLGLRATHGPRHEPARAPAQQPGLRQARRDGDRPDLRRHGAQPVPRLRGGRDDLRLGRPQPLLLGAAAGQAAAEEAAHRDEDHRSRSTRSRTPATASVSWNAN